MPYLTCLFAAFEGLPLVRCISLIIDEGPPLATEPLTAEPRVEDTQTADPLIEFSLCL